MIELRWMARWVDGWFPSIHGGHPCKEKEMVLQYRYLGERVQTGVTEWTRAWSEWQDVPVVHE